MVAIKVEIDFLLELFVTVMCEHNLIISVKTLLDKTRIFVL